MVLIRDFKIGEEITGYYLVKAKNIKTSSANKTYIDFTLQDISGEVNAKLWEAKGDVETQYNPGEIVKILASVTQWQQTSQLKIIKIRGLLPEDDVDFSQENFNFYEVIKTKNQQSLQSVSEPSKNAIWITM